MFWERQRHSARERESEERWCGRLLFCAGWRGCGGPPCWRGLLVVMSRPHACLESCDWSELEAPVPVKGSPVTSFSPSLSQYRRERTRILYTSAPVYLTLQQSIISNRITPRPYLCALGHENVLVLPWIPYWLTHAYVIFDLIVSVVDSSLITTASSLNVTLFNENRAMCATNKDRGKLARKQLHDANAPCRLLW